MPRLIRADVILAMFLVKNREITFKALRELRHKVESKIPEITLDISGPSIVSVVELYPFLFSKRDDTIARVENVDDLYEALVSSLPQDAITKRLNELVNAD